MGRSRVPQHRHITVRRGAALRAAGALILITTGIAATGTAQAANATWHFSVSVSIAQSQADTYGGTAAAQAAVVNQLDTVNHRFNDPGVFTGVLDFQLVSFSTYTDSDDAEVAATHPGSDLHLVYPSDSCTSGGWWGIYQAIGHCWLSTFDGGPFGSDATDGLVHEFGHFRGAVDEYALAVPSSGNPVNGATFTAPESIMTYPYGVHTWDPYTIGIVNWEGAAADVEPAEASTLFPHTVSVKAVTATRRDARSAPVTLYPVAWFSNGVSATPALTGSTNSQGMLTLPANPFGAGTSGFPWDIVTPNFLVVIQTTDGHSGYGWLNIIDVGVAYLTHPHAPAYTLRIPVT